MDSRVSNRTLYATQGRHSESASATVKLSRDLFLEIIAQATTFADELKNGTISIDGDAGALLTISAIYDNFSTRLCDRGALN